MDKAVKPISEDKFHEVLHLTIDKPVKNFRKKWSFNRKRRVKVNNGAHQAGWAEATVSPTTKQININVFLDYKKNDLPDIDYEKLKRLSSEGIAQYWSRDINIDSERFSVKVIATHRSKNSIPVDLYIEKDKTEYARSMNPAILGIDASFIYNEGVFSPAQADLDFKLVSAHEFGHSVLMYAGGISLSWGHKGSTNPILQSVKSSTPGYPNKGAIDLMKYYDWSKSRVDFMRRMNDSIAMEVDVKRLIWGSQIKWLK